MILLLAWLYFLAANSFVWANCEAGGYGIHTSATYKAWAPSEIYLVGKRDGAKLKAALNSQDSHSDTVALLPGTYEVKGPKVSCKSRAKFEFSSVYNNEDPYSDQSPFWWDISTCPGLDLKESTYLRVDGKAKVIAVPGMLSVKEVGSVPGLDLPKAVLDRVKKLSAPTELTNYQWKAPLKLELSKVSSLRLRITQVGKDFYSIEAFAPIERSGEEWSKLGKDFTGAKGGERAVYEFPILFFYSKKTGLKQVGDGSECTSLVESAPKAGLHSRGVLGGYGMSDFQVTHAFDFDGDGAPEVIEVNERFAYRLGPNGLFEVINVGMGC